MTHRQPLFLLFASLVLPACHDSGEWSQDAELPKPIVEDFRTRNSDQADRHEVAKVGRHTYPAPNYQIDPPLPAAGADTSSKDSKQQGCLSILGLIFNKSIDEEVVSLTPGLLEGILSASCQEKLETVVSSIEQFDSHPIGAHIPELVGAILNGEKLEVPPAVADRIADEISYQAPLVLDEIMQKVENETDPSTRAFGEILFRKIMGSIASE